MTGQHLRTGGPGETLRRVAPRLAIFVLMCGYLWYAINYHLTTTKTGTWFLLGFYAFIAVTLTWSMWSATQPRTFGHLPRLDARVVCIIPAYNEEPELLRATIESLIDQSYPLVGIHVMDDGSSTPVERFDHPLVSWHRQDNMGKRFAQANVLRDIDPDGYDLILTVDSDSVIDREAVDHFMHAMSNPKIQAATGLILVRNRTENLVTRLSDVDIVVSCMMVRMARSIFGAVSPTSGALAIYRKAVILDNLDDYVGSGTNGDDRRLSLYALLRGQVVAVHEALVDTAMPNTIRGSFTQRMRWAKSGWQALPWSITNLPLTPLYFVIYPFVFALVWPFLMVWGAWLLIAQHSPVILYGVGYWMIVRLVQTLIYAIRRPRLTLLERLGAVAMTPLLLPYVFLAIKPAKYWALLKLRQRGWHTRGNVHAAPTHAVQERVAA